MTGVKAESFVVVTSLFVNPLPLMSVLDSSNSAANKYTMSKKWTNGNIIIFLSRKHCG